MKRLLMFSAIAVLCAISFIATGCWEDMLCPVDEPPSVIIVKPASSGGLQTLSTITMFGWETGTSRNPRSIRYFVSQNIDSNGIYDPTFDLIRDLNTNPSRYEDRWSNWISWYAEGDSGRTTVIGDDEILMMNRTHVFAVQAKDWCGRITEVFLRDVNTRTFIVSRRAGPILTVSETYLGYSKFLGTAMFPVKYDIPPGLPLNFTWQGDASNYGGEIVAYRYGWNVQDLDDPEQWDTFFSPYILAAPERRLYSGVHILYIEVLDFARNITRAQIMVEVVPFTMNRNLLWVDDFYATDPQSPLYEMPGETNHDNFWYGICSTAEGWDQSQDVYDCREHNLAHPDIREIGRYKNVIWTYSSTYNAWSEVVRFTPESHVGGGTFRPPNYLPMFLAVGGHLWTSGRGDRAGGLAAMLPPQAQMFPMSLLCEITGNKDEDECIGDRSGEDCMGYRDYCVTVLDKVNGMFRTDGDMPLRHLDRDAMRYAYRDDADPVTAMHPGLPESLELWEEVTQPGRFFDPYVRGFYYVEVYDPQYWMNTRSLTSQSCFHPMYRMRSVSSLSPLYETPAALWITKYEDVVPNVESGIAVAAPSVHFGFPLWFFDRDAVDAIAGVVFDEWEIRAE